MMMDENDGEQYCTYLDSLGFFNQCVCIFITGFSTTCSENENKIGKNK
jgi:hypothetical protein